MAKIANINQIRTVENPMSIITHKPSGNSKVIYEKDSFWGPLKSKLLILRRVENLKGNIRIPTWLAFIIGLFLLLLLAILIASIVIVTTSRKPGLHMEDCIKRSCNTALNLKCIENKCQCESNEYYITKCTEKVGYQKKCQLSLQCFDELECIGGNCTCNETTYWTGSKCVKRKLLKDACNGDQCLTSSFLYCDAKIKVCVCDLNTRYIFKTLLKPI